MDQQALIPEGQAAQSSVIVRRHFVRNCERRKITSAILLAEVPAPGAFYRVSVDVVTEPGDGVPFVRLGRSHTRGNDNEQVIGHRIFWAAPGSPIQLNVDAQATDKAYDLMAVLERL